MGNQALNTDSPNPLSEAQREALATDRYLRGIYMELDAIANVQRRYEVALNIAEETFNGRDRRNRIFLALRSAAENADPVETGNPNATLVHQSVAEETAPKRRRMLETQEELDPNEVVFGTLERPIVVEDEENDAYEHAVQESENAGLGQGDSHEQEESLSESSNKTDWKAAWRAHLAVNYDVPRYNEFEPWNSTDSSNASSSHAAEVNLTGYNSTEFVDTEDEDLADSVLNTFLRTHGFNRNQLGRGGGGST